MPATRFPQALAIFSSALLSKRASRTPAILYVHSFRIRNSPQREDRRVVQAARSLCPAAPHPDACFKRNIQNLHKSCIDMIFKKK